MSDEPGRANRLAGEKSPYLLQHAHNPVDWYPWGEEAFRKAREEDKPVFLSIGYSTCHWCHVMERESFEDARIAAQLNAGFVPVKVDREERPDIDKVFMSYVVGTTGSGGWPMTVFLTPEGRPFYGGTYFPPENRWGRPGLPTVLQSVSDGWKNEKEKILAAAKEAAAFLAAAPDPGAGRAPDEEILREGVRHFAAAFDAQNGGFGGAPKFPSPHSISFLLRAHARFKNPAALRMAETTLRAMARGGIFDHLGGGFHRYSVDAEWRVPHFEKMLYDQAMLLLAYTEAWQATGNASYAGTVRRTADYVLRDLRSEEGAFFSAEDADSEDPGDPAEKREGAFYLWTEEEIRGLLPARDADAFIDAYGIRKEGNLPAGQAGAPADPAGEFEGKNILYRARTGREEQDRDETLARSEAVLLAARGARPRPHLDDKILTDWNGLAIAALATAGGALEEPRYRDAAARAAEFVLKRLRDDRGFLLHRYRDGEAAIAGQLDDYAFFVFGLLRLYEATLDDRWLAEALALAERMTGLFWDERGGGFFMTARGADALLIARPKEGADGAIPSGNSLAACDLLMLGKITGDSRWEKKARRLLEAFADSLHANPGAHAQMLAALAFSLGPSREIAISADPDDTEALAMADEVRRRFLPETILLFNRTGKTGDRLRAIAPFLVNQPPINGRATAYVCVDRVCREPVRSLEALKSSLD